MTENTTITGQFGESLSMRVFELLSAEEFLIFFAASDSDLPGNNVRLELRVLAIHDRQIANRSMVGVIVTDVVSGAIGGAAWDAIKATYTALAEYLRRKHDAPAVDAAAIVQRLTAASERILGPGSTAFENLKMKQLEDLRWEAEFTSHGVAVRATVDPGGNVVKWNQRTVKG
jgi:hypothetical protein